MKIRTINPFSEEVISEYELLGFDRAAKVTSDVKKAFLTWRTNTPAQRAWMIQSLSHVLEDKKDEFAEIMTLEMGKARREAVAEVEKCAWLCDYYAQTGPTALMPEPIYTEAMKSYVRFDPIGVVLAIMPWNFPFWQVFRAAVPAMLAGNTLVLKHASNVPGCALKIEGIFREAGFPKDTFRTLIISSTTALKLIDEDLVDGVTLTGSSQAGSKVAQTAGKRVKKVVLELGGSDPFIVFADADIKKAAKVAVTARMLNTGQSCIAAKRFIVEKDVFEEFKDQFIKTLKTLKMGNPTDPDTAFGPLARADFVVDLDRQLKDAIEKGADIVRTHEYKGPGYMFAPAVATNVSPDMAIFSEETFGPIAPIIPFSTVEEAVNIANSTPYGLGGAVWTSDLAKAEVVAANLDCGAVTVNDMVKSDPRMPFGGTKKSGMGRELSHYGLKEFVNIKSVVIAKPE